MTEEELYEPTRIFMAGPDFEPTHPGRLTKRFRAAYNTSRTQWLSEAGDWMKPDVTLINAAKRRFDPIPDLTVHAVEIKLSRQSLVSGLFQALSYSRIADYCYLAAPVEAKWTDRIDDLANRFGVGLIKIRIHDGTHSFNVTPAERKSPDPDLRDEYIDAILSETNDKSDILQILARQP